MFLNHLTKLSGSDQLKFISAVRHRPSITITELFACIRKLKSDQVPIYMVLGMATIVASLGIYTAMHQVLHSPNVIVSKKKRESLPEVDNPEVVVSDADKFVSKSLFRKLAHLKEHHHQDPSHHVETLKNVE